MTNVEAWFNNSLRPRKPEGSLGRTAQDGHLDSHTAPELCLKVSIRHPTYTRLRPFGGPSQVVERLVDTLTMRVQTLTQVIPDSNVLCNTSFEVVFSSRDIYALRSVRVSYITTIPLTQCASSTVR